MSKTTILIGAILIALIGGGLVFYFAFKTPNPSTTQPGVTTGSPRMGSPISTQSQVGGDTSSSVPLPKFTADPNKLIDSTKKLSYEERQRLSLLVGNMAGTIQTYGYNDYSEVLALSDYFTVKGQAALQAYVQQLEQNTKSGYRQYAVADSTAQIALYYNQATKVYTATVFTLIYNLSNLKNIEVSGRQIIDLELTRDGESWKFNNVSLYSK